MKKILIIEDDAVISRVEKDFLQINGFEADITEEGIKGLEEALTGRYDLILLDLMLPGIDGLEICRRIRDEIDVPILMVTARIEDVDKIRGLGLGADDYIAKPFSPTELVARVKSHLARYDRLVHKGAVHKETDKEISFGNLKINIDSHRVYVDGSEIECKNKEYELLYFLMSNPEIVFSRETLYERIWGSDSFGDSRTVSVHINRLREKIEQDPHNPDHIQTVWGAGYRFKI